MASPPAPAPLAQTVSVETPELVVFSYTVAGIGSRAAAAIVDLLVSVVAMLAVVLGIALLLPTGERSRLFPSEVWALALFAFAQFAILWGYYVLFEGLSDGQTPGKRLLGLRVVRDGGYSVGFAASAVRNIVRIVDLQPGATYAAGVVSILLSRSGKRLGDIVAGTIVVREQLVPRTIVAARGGAAPPESGPALQTMLRDDEYAVLERFAERRAELDASRRKEIARALGARFATALGGIEGTSDAARLMSLYDNERRARAAGAVARGQTGAARERHAIIAAGSPRWAAFSARLAEAQRRGLRSLGETGVREFVAEYRALAADLARLQTAERGGDSHEVFYLSRLVAGAHNLLYRGRTIGPADVVRFIFVDAPREVRRSAAPILFAAALLFGPAAIAYTAVVEQPSVAAIFIPPQMLDRAEEGIRRAREGTGYIPDPQIFRPVMASRIIANNVQVTFGAFAFGITAGIGTLVLLLFNGISLGGVFGLYASKGIASLLLAFVAPHGVLELTAICIAGGGGFLLAAALLLPGRRTRRTALVENGRRAIRLIGASTVLLLFAGTLEGFVSPIPWWPLEVKLAVSGVTALGLVMWLKGGRGSREADGARGDEGRGTRDEELLGLGAVRAAEERTS